MKPPGVERSSLAAWHSSTLAEKMITESLKDKSEQWLRKHRIKINPHLPVIEDRSNLMLRKPEEVSIRAWILKHIVAIGYNQNPTAMMEAIERKGLKNYTSNDEVTFLARNEFSEREKWEAIELCHCIHALVWVLGFRDLDPLGGCPDDVADLFFGGTYTVSSLADASKPRGFQEVYEMADLLYRLHWAARDANLSRANFPISEWCVMNRRRAIDWALTVEHDWDEIPTDT